MSPAGRHLVLTHLQRPTQTRSCLAQVGSEPCSLGRNECICLKMKSREHSSFPGPWWEYVLPHESPAALRSQTRQKEATRRPWTVPVYGRSTHRPGQGEAGPWKPWGTPSPESVTRRHRAQTGRSWSPGRPGCSSLLEAAEGHGGRGGRVLVVGGHLGVSGFRTRGLWAELPCTEEGGPPEVLPERGSPHSPNCPISRCLSFEVKLCSRHSPPGSGSGHGKWVGLAGSLQGGPGISTGQMRGSRCE